MKLTYRGQAYETSAQPQAHIPASSKLIYRGHTYSYSPRPVVPEAANGPTVTLIYRGATYERSLPARPYQTPRAINWRYQTQEG